MLLPLRTVVQHVVVVHGDLHSPGERSQGADTGDVAKHGVLRLEGIMESSETHDKRHITHYYLPELAVGTEAVLDLVPEAGSVHRG